MRTDRGKFTATEGPPQQPPSQRPAMVLPPPFPLASPYRPAPLDTDLEARFAAAPKAPKRMLAAQAQSREFGERLKNFRDEVGGLCGRGGSDSSGRGTARGSGKGRARFHDEKAGLLGMGKRSVSCDRFPSRTDEWDFRTDDEDEHSPGAEQRDQDPQSAPPPAAPRPPKILSRHDLHPTTKPFAPSLLGSPFATPAPSPPQPPSAQPASPAPNTPSAPKDPLSTHLLTQHTLLRSRTLPRNTRFSHALAHFATSRALLLLAHSPARAAEIFERVRGIFGLESAVRATREAERVVLGREVQHWKVGLDSGGRGGGGREGRMWCEALAEGFGGLGEVALTGCEGRGGADGELKRVESGTRGYWNSAACADGRDHGDGLGSGGGDASPGIPGSSAAENRGRGFERGGRGMRGRGRGSGRGGGRGANGLLADGGMRGLGTRLAMFMPPDMESG